MVPSVHGDKSQKVDMVITAASDVVCLGFANRLLAAHSEEPRGETALPMRPPSVIAMAVLFERSGFIIVS